MIRVRKNGAIGWPWTVYCDECRTTELLMNSGINTPIGWSSWRRAMTQAWNHLSTWRHA